MKAKQGQSFFDLVIQGTGNIEQAFDMTLLNERSSTDTLAIGEAVEPTNKIKKSVQSLFSKDRIPASALTEQNITITDPAEGIGEMVVNSTFIVY